MPDGISSIAFLMQLSAERTGVSPVPSSAIADASLVSILTESFARQGEWYRQLRANVQKTLSKMVLSRGDPSSVMANFAEKQKLLESIAHERERIKDQISLWQERKTRIAVSAGTEDLNRILLETEGIIREFLDSEEQIRKYLQHMMEANKQETPK
jgi:hypothetical protein